MKTPSFGRACRTALCTLSLATSASFAASAPMWADDFNQPANSAPDASRWVYDLGSGGWGNNELQTYTNSTDNASVVNDPEALDGKELHIRAVKSGSGAYTSARLKTLGKFSATYGRIEARLKMTNGQGIWPAFWMLGNNIATAGWPACGEIDVVEIVNANPQQVHGTLHGPGYSGAQSISGTTTLPTGTLDQAYHVYTVDWSPDKIVWSFDGTVFHTVTSSTIPAGSRWVFNDAPFFLLLNVAVGGNWPGNPTSETPFPQTFAIDYVRIYQAGPPPPAELGALGSSANEVALTWLPPANPGTMTITGYRIERASNAAFTDPITIAITGAITSFSDTNVGPAVTYYYRVMAVSGEGTSTASEVRSVSTPAAAIAGTVQFANISSRAYCERGNNVTIGGFVISGSAAMRVLVRAVGPTLIAAGISNAEALLDPVIRVYRGSSLIATNDDWTTNANQPELLTTASRIGAMPLSATDTKSAALLLSLPPAVYSFVTTGKDNTSGIVLIEAYNAGMSF